MQLHIYTDGGYKRRKGSWAFYVVEHTLLKGETMRTSKLGSYEPELKAVMEALRHIEEVKPSHAHIYTDHFGIVHMIKKNFPNWESNSDVREPVKFWGPIWSLYNPSTTTVHWVSNKNKTNRIVDAHCAKLLKEGFSESILQI